MSLALNRHHKERIKNKVKNYYNCNTSKHDKTKRIGIIASTRCICSCHMCRNYGLSHRDAKILNDPDY